MAPERERSYFSFDCSIPPATNFLVLKSPCWKTRSHEDKKKGRKKERKGERQKGRKEGRQEERKTRRKEYKKKG